MTVENLRAEVSDKVQTGSVCVAPFQNLNLNHTRLTLGPDFTQTGGKNVQNKYEYSCTGGAKSEKMYLNFPEKMLKLMSIDNMSEG